jgi:hypothetical protein
MYKKEFLQTRDPSDPHLLHLKALFRLYSGSIQALFTKAGYKEHTHKHEIRDSHLLHLKTLFRLYSGSIQALFRLYAGSIQAHLQARDP